jgi:type IV secretory pathway TrbL component
MKMLSTTKSICAALLCLAATGALAQSPSVIGSVKIDMSGIPTGAVETRRQLQACLTRAVPTALGTRMQPGLRGAAVLVVRPTSVWLSSQSTAGISDDFNSQQGSVGADLLEGDAIIGGQRIAIAAAANGDFGATSWSEYGARLRVEQLCNNFALWLARKV